MKRVIGDQERAQRAAARLRVLQHFEQVSRNISRTCRFFGISRTLFYEWRRRYHRAPRGTTRPFVAFMLMSSLVKNGSRGNVELRSAEQP